MDMIEIISVESGEWPEGCAYGEGDGSCNQGAKKAGYQVVISYYGVEFEFQKNDLHANKDALITVIGDVAESLGMGTNQLFKAMDF